MIVKENDNKIIVFTEQFDYKNRQIIVPIEINTETEYNLMRVKANVTLSAYGKTNIGNFVNNLFNKNAKVVYSDTKKLQNLNDSHKVQYPVSISSVSNNNIPQSNKKVNLPTAITNSNMQEGQNNTIKTLPIVSKNSKPGIQIVPDGEVNTSRFAENVQKSKIVSDKAKLLPKTTILHGINEDTLLAYKYGKLVLLTNCLYCTIVI